MSEVSGLRIKDCDLVAKCLHISPTPWRGLKTTNSQRSVPLSAEAVAALGKFIQNNTQDPEEPLFARYAKERGADSCSAMLMKRLRTVITGEPCLGRTPCTANWETATVRPCRRCPWCTRGLRLC